jgi:hypothetical protein
MASKCAYKKHVFFKSSLGRLSILYWQHLNFLGEYDFSTKKIKDSAGLEGPALMKSNVVTMWDESQGYLQL